jgi:hypothetical protein
MRTAQTRVERASSAPILVNLLRADADHSPLDILNNKSELGKSADTDFTLSLFHTTFCMHNSIANGSLFHS